MVILLSLTSSISWPFRPAMIDAYFGSASETTTLLIFTRRIAAIAVPSGARSHHAEPYKYRSRRHVAHCDIRDRNIFDRAAVHRFNRKAAAVDKIDVRDRYVFLKPPFDSVPNFSRPVGRSRSGANSCVVLNVPSRKLPRSKPETWEFVMVTFSVARLNPSA